MGTWGHEAFANDAALDWAPELSVAGMTLIRQTLDAVFEDDYVDAVTASEALAACEVIARLRGNWGRRDAGSETADVWVETHPQRVGWFLRRKALKAIDRILSEESELRELWFEGAGGPDWKTYVLDLRRRVAG